MGTVDGKTERYVIFSLFINNINTEQESCSCGKH